MLLLVLVERTFHAFEWRREEGMLDADLLCASALCERHWERHTKRINHNGKVALQSRLRRSNRCLYTASVVFFPFKEQGVTSTPFDYFAFDHSRVSFVVPSC